MRLQLREDSPIVAWLEEHRHGVVDTLARLHCTELEVRNVTERRIRLAAVIGNYTLTIYALKELEVPDGLFDRQVDNDELCIIVDWCIVGN